MLKKDSPIQYWAPSAWDASGWRRTNSLNSAMASA